MKEEGLSCKGAGEFLFWQPGTSGPLRPESSMIQSDFSDCLLYNVETEEWGEGTRACYGSTAAPREEPGEAAKWCNLSQH